MDDLISRRVAIDALHMHLMYRMGTDSNKKRLDEWINSLPSAQPDIIRCKDCKHRDKYGCCKYWKGLAMGDIPIATDDYDFCSYAKRI